MTKGYDTDAAGYKCDWTTGVRIYDPESRWLGPFACEQGHDDCSQYPSGRCTLAATSDLVGEWLRDKGYTEWDQVPAEVQDRVWEDIEARVYPDDPRENGRVPRPPAL